MADLIKTYGAIGLVASSIGLFGVGLVADSLVARGLLVVIALGMALRGLSAYREGTDEP